MASGKAPGIDGIRAKQLKLAFPIIGDVLLKIVNASLTEGKFPECWKVGLISPIPKVDGSEEPVDFRPVTLLKIASKVLERIVSIQSIVCVSHKNPAANAASEWLSQESLNRNPRARSY